MRLFLLFALLLAAAARAQPLPPEVEAALVRARLPLDAVTLLVADVDARQPPRLRHRAEAPVNPASIAKLATTFAALELLGPAYTWPTPVFVDGPVVAGTLQGNLYIQGRGDPKLVIERLWLLLRRVRALGIERVAGDIVLDRSAFATAAADPGAFDGEPLRPYNALPDALLLNFKAQLVTFTPREPMAILQVEPPLAGVQWPPAVPLAPGECGDWRAQLKPDFSDPARVRMTGSYPATCGERTWSIAHPDAAGYAARAVAALWQDTGGKLTGQVREGPVPAGLPPLLEATSPSLGEVVRDTNKYSNNVMAQQLFLTLSLQKLGTGTPDGSRALLAQWWRDRFGPEVPTFGNGSGLSREERITAAQLGRLLQYAWASPLMPELVASLPIAGTDGTMRRTRGTGAAHLKTGSLRDVWGVAGYVHGASGRRYVLVAIANHPNAHGLRPALEALLAWAARDQPIDRP